MKRWSLFFLLTIGVGSFIPNACFSDPEDVYSESENSQLPIFKHRQEARKMIDEIMTLGKKLFPEQVYHMMFAGMDEFFEALDYQDKCMAKDLKGEAVYRTSEEIFKNQMSFLWESALKLPVENNFIRQHQKPENPTLEKVLCFAANLVEAWTPSGNVIKHPTVTDKTLDKFLKCVFVENKYKTTFLPWIAKRDLGFFTLTIAFLHHIFPLGFSEQKVFADERDMYPDDFFTHDAFHGLLVFEAKMDYAKSPEKEPICATFLDGILKSLLHEQNAKTWIEKMIGAFWIVHEDFDRDKIRALKEKSLDTLTPDQLLEIHTNSCIHQFDAPPFMIKQLEGIENFATTSIPHNTNIEESLKKFSNYIKKYTEDRNSQQFFQKHFANFVYQKMRSLQSFLPFLRASNFSAPWPKDLWDAVQSVREKEGSGWEETFRKLFEDNTCSDCTAFVDYVNAFGNWLKEAVNLTYKDAAPHMPEWLPL